MNTSQYKSMQVSGLSNLLLPDFITDPDPEIYLYGKYAVIDFETYSRHPGVPDPRDPDAGIVLAVVALHLGHGDNSDSPRIESYVGSEFEMGALGRRLEDVDFVVAHNSKYELGWLYRMGVDLRRVLPYCTQIGEYVRYGNIRKRFDLDSTAKRYGAEGKHRFVSALLKAGVSSQDIPTGLLRVYCEGDVRATHQIFLKQRDYLAENGLLAVAYARNITTPALAQIEFEGVQVDEPRVRAEAESVFREYDDVSRSIGEFTGGINFNSPKQVTEYLYDKLGFEELQDWRGNPLRTEKGGRKADASTIAGLKATTPEQRELKRLLGQMAPLKRQVDTLKKLQKACKDDDGIIKATFNQTVTQTHRLSSSGGKYKLQFHNFPRSYKSLFRARRAGWLVCEADAPQLEFRVAVDVGNDARGRADILGGVDVHQLTSEVMGLARTPAKAFTFKPLYGGQSGSDRARKYYKAFRERYSEVYRTQLGWTNIVLGTKQLKIPSGLIFYWPDTELTKSGYITNTPSIFNYPIQSFATADIIPLTLVLVWHKIKSLETVLVNTIHDSIIAEVPPNEVDEYREILVESFTRDIYWMLKKLYNYEFQTPLGVGIKFGTFWGEGEEEKHEGHRTGNFG